MFNEKTHNLKMDKAIEVFSKVFSSSSPNSLDFKSFFKSSFASLRIFLIETLHFSPIDLINFLSSLLLSSLSSGTGNLIS